MPIITPKKPFESDAEITKALEVLRNFFGAQPDGAILSWVEIEQGTGVDMHSRVKGAQPGRNLVRRALAQLKRPYSPNRGYGIQLSAANTALPIANTKLKSVRNKLRKTGKDLGRLLERHSTEMISDERAALQLKKIGVDFLSWQSVAIVKAKPEATKQPPPERPVPPLGKLLRQQEQN